MKKTNIPEYFPYNGQTCFVKNSTDLKDYIHGGFDNSSKDILATNVLKKLIKKYGSPDCGRNRATFISKRYVIKFPLNDDGEINNYSEGGFNSDITAKGKLLIIDDFVCLIQEKLWFDKKLHIMLKNNFPKWVDMIDNKQIGYNLNNELKAYDFAEDINKLNYYLNKKNNKSI